MQLKTDYVDDVFSGSRKYQEILNEDNTKSFVDRTNYSRNGTRFGARDINDTNSAVNKLYNPREFTLNKDSWLNASGMFVYRLEISDIKASDNVSLVKIIDTSTASTLAKLKEYNKNFSYIVGGNTEQGNIGLVAIKRPSIDLKVGVKGV